MTGFNLPPGVSGWDIPGNSPEDVELEQFFDRCYHLLEKVSWSEGYPLDEGEELMENDAFCDFLVAIREEALEQGRHAAEQYAVMARNMGEESMFVVCRDAGDSPAFGIGGEFSPVSIARSLNAAKSWVEEQIRDEWAGATMDDEEVPKYEWSTKQESHQRWHVYMEVGTSHDGSFYAITKVPIPPQEAP